MKKSIGISVFLIAIGVVFLLDNLDVIDISVSELIRTYWPVILIWMGVEKLVRDFKEYTFFPAKNLSLVVVFLFYAPIQSFLAHILER